MNFLADESVDGQLVDRLRRGDHLVLYVAEMEPGISDNDVLDLANRRDALLLTADKDFGELVFRQRRIVKGVVLLRLAGLSPEARALFANIAINRHGAQLTAAFTVITSGRVRIRHLRA
ncbi:MAG TPA: DUF5615 family PIN-like protein [Dehalococcoidia bacterium]|nr:DUF5615 family PIN-like protein [Dehalococcoidia bacterium]